MMKKKLSKKIQDKIDKGADKIGGVDANELKKAVEKRNKTIDNNKPVKK